MNSNKRRPKHFYLIHQSPPKLDSKTDKSSSSINIFKDAEPLQDYFPTCPDINPFSSTEPAPPIKHAQMLTLGTPRQAVQNNENRRTIQDETIYKQSIVKRYHSNLHKLDKLKSSSSTINHPQNNRSHTQRNNSKILNKMNTQPGDELQYKQNLSDRRVYMEQAKNSSNLDVTHINSSSIRNSSSQGHYHHGGSVNININSINSIKGNVYLKGKSNTNMNRNSNLVNNINKYMYSKAIVSEIVYNQDLRTRCGIKYFEQDLRNRHKQQMKPVPYIYAIPASSNAQSVNTKFVKNVRQMHPNIRIKQKMKVIGVNRSRINTQGSQLDSIDVELINKNRGNIRNQLEQ